MEVIECDYNISNVNTLTENWVGIRFFTKESVVSGRKSVLYKKNERIYADLLLNIDFLHCL